jgi:hypothetical protein
MATPAEAVAAALCVAPGDVRVIARGLGSDGPGIPPSLMFDLEAILNPLGMRTLPELWADPNLEPWEELVDDKP